MLQQTLAESSLAHVPAYTASASCIHTAHELHAASGNTNSDANTDHDTTGPEAVRNAYRKSSYGLARQKITSHLVERQHVKLRALCSGKYIDGYEHARLDIHTPARDDDSIRPELQRHIGRDDFRTDHRNSALMSKGGMIYWTV